MKFNELQVSNDRKFSCKKFSNKLNKILVTNIL